MLTLRPNCELCNKDLPANSLEAMICTYECTFYTDCVAQVLNDVCPNCGGGFCARPIRPATARRPGVGLEHQPASDKRVTAKYTRAEIIAFSSKHVDIPAKDR